MNSPSIVEIVQQRIDAAVIAIGSGVTSDRFVASDWSWDSDDYPTYAEIARGKFKVMKAYGKGKTAKTPVRPMGKKRGR